MQQAVNRVNPLVAAYPNVALVDWANRVKDDELSSDGSTRMRTTST